eukprot:2342609-Amphidinium_carterae.2
MLDPGQCVLIRYALAGEDGELWHSRIVLSKIGKRASHIVVSPDYEIYEEELSLSNADLDGVRVCGPKGQRPAGLRGRVYEFDPFPESDTMRRLVEEGRLLAQQLAAEDALAAGGVAGAMAGPMAPGGGAMWRAAANMSGKKHGDVVGVEDHAVVYGGRYTITTTETGEYVFAELVEESALEKFLGRAVENEARVLPIVKSKEGLRRRTLQQVATESREVEMADWPLQGPRTAGWCLSYLVREGTGIEQHHERIRGLLRLDSNSWGITEHMQLCTALRLATETDQLDITNLSCMELLLRRVQTIEFSYQQKLQDMEGKGGQGRLSQEEAGAFAGTTRSVTQLMVAPSLTEHVRTELEREGKLFKHLRQAREEREAARKGKGGDKKNES